MIVKNGAAAGLERCLSSVAGWVDRMVIGDTGSSDATPEIARRFGAELFTIPWEGDFALARNRVLDRCRCDWVLILDADEMIDAAGAHHIRELLDKSEVAAWESWRWNYMRERHSRLGWQAALPNPGAIAEASRWPAYVPALTLRLFRNHSGIRYEGCVHETVMKRLQALGLATGRADFVVHHFGHAEDSDADRNSKNDLYQSLIQTKLGADPSDPQSLFELGLGELEHFRRPTAALSLFERACSIDPRFSVSWLFAGICLTRMGDAGEALRRLARAAQLGLRTSVFLQAVGDAYFHANCHAEARQAYAAALEQGEASPLSVAKLGACEVRLGRIETGLSRMQNAVASDPDFAELYDILAAGALLAGDLCLAARTVEARGALGPSSELHTRLKALIAERSAANGELTAAR